MGQTIANLIRTENMSKKLTNNIIEMILLFVDYNLLYQFLFVDKYFYNRIRTFAFRELRLERRPHAIDSVTHYDTSVLIDKMKCHTDIHIKLDKKYADIFSKFTQTISLQKYITIHNKRNSNYYSIYLCISYNPTYEVHIQINDNIDWHIHQFTGTLTNNQLYNFLYCMVFHQDIHVVCQSDVFGKIPMLEEFTRTKFVRSARTNFPSKYTHRINDREILLSNISSAA